MIQIKRMNDYAPLLHNGLFHRKNNNTIHTISFTLLRFCACDFEWALKFVSKKSR